MLFGFLKYSFQLLGTPPTCQHISDSVLYDFDILPTCLCVTGQERSFSPFLPSSLIYGQLVLCLSLCLSHLIFYAYIYACSFYAFAYPSYFCLLFVTMLSCTYLFHSQVSLSSFFRPDVIEDVLYDLSNNF